MKILKNTENTLAGMKLHLVIGGIIYMKMHRMHMQHMPECILTVRIYILKYISI